MTVLRSVPLSLRSESKSSARLLPVGRLSRNWRAEFQRKEPEVVAVPTGVALLVSVASAFAIAATVSAATAVSSAAGVVTSPAPPATDLVDHPVAEVGLV